MRSALWCLLGWAWAGVSPGIEGYRMALPEGVERPFVAPEIWSTPMMDWRISEGRLEMLHGGRNHNVQLLTHQMVEGEGSVRMVVRVGALRDHGGDGVEGVVGFSFAVCGAIPGEYRSALFGGQGLVAGVTTRGRLVLGRHFSGRLIDPAQLDDIWLELLLEEGGGKVKAEIVARGGGRGGIELGRHSAELTTRPMAGNVGLTARPVGEGRAEGQARFWFSDWEVGGSKVASRPEQVFGPVLWTQYTVHRGVMKMTAQLVPVGAGENQVAVLDLLRGGSWEPVAEAELDPLARTAEFRIEGWDAGSDVRYRVRFRWLSGRGELEDSWEGVVRRDPVDKPVVSLAALSCMVDYAFPNQYVAGNVKEQDPDLLFFAGDQLYEGVAGYGVVRARDESEVGRATLNYLPKWWLFGWSFREVMRDRPTVIIMDDHDVYHGNLWGRGGRAMERGGTTSSSGGYDMHPSWVNMAQRTQTSHLPDPVDPRPVEQGIGVYFTALEWGGVGFAILEDRKFKSAPGDVLERPVGASRRLDHVLDADFDTRLLDRPGLELLGERQMAFLEGWVGEWEGQVMKAVLSQSPFAAVATTHGSADNRLVADLDSNGWPQRARGDALRVIRKGHAMMVHGDQHLATLVHHGVDEWGDSGWSYATPGIANGYKRIWDPLEPGRNRRRGAPEYTGEFLDGFGNRVTVWAAANRADMDGGAARAGQVPMVDRLNETGSGYGIIRFDKGRQVYVVESWGVGESLAGASQHEGWPREIGLDEQYGRRAVGELDEVELGEGQSAVVRVYEEEGGELVSARRVVGPGHRPRVYDEGRAYRVEVEVER